MIICSDVNIMEFGESRTPNSNQSIVNENDEYSGNDLSNNLPQSKEVDIVTPNLRTYDTEEQNRHSAFCNRCRTISSSLLSSNFRGKALYATECTGYPDSCRFDQSVQQYYSVPDDDVPLLGEENTDGNEMSIHQRCSASSISLEDHCHTPRFGGTASRRAITKLLIACCFTTLFMIAEVVGGYLSNSIAIMSDAAHMFSDLTSFIVSLVAIYLAMRPASRKLNYGYYRAEVLGAVVSVLIIWVITAMLVYAAIERCISMDFEVDGDAMIIVSALGVVMNIILGIVLHSGHGGHGHSHGFTTAHGQEDGHGHSHSHPQQSAHEPLSDASTDVSVSIGVDPLSSSEAESKPLTEPPKENNINIRAAFIHVLGDLFQSIGVLIAAYIIRYHPEYKIADPICTFIFSVIVLITTLPILRDLGRVLMEAVPPGVEYNSICSHLTALPSVKMVHSLHVWALTVDKNALSVHLAIDAEADSDEVLRAAQKVIRSNHHIYHTTIQVERYSPLLMDNCVQCQPLP